MLLKDTELIIQGTDRDGEQYPPAYAQPGEYELLEKLIQQYRTHYPRCIHIKVNIALPDPDFMRDK